MTQQQPIKIAILAMGGEGGGVLADWIVDLGEHHGWHAQTTSVPGVAQRTGATIYYVELLPPNPQAPNRQPVLALMPMPGDVDVVLCSELMEAGRAVQRGLVTSDRTTLLTSTHRVYAIAEKAAMGDGRVSDEVLLKYAQAAARKLVSFDMARAAEACGSVISAVLFGALCGTGALPFGRADFEATIERGGVGVKPSLKAFARGCQEAMGQGASAAPAKPAVPAPAPRSPEVIALLARVQREHRPACQDVVREGVRRLIDYQDADYAVLYLDRLAQLTQRAAPDDDTLVRETARHLALWMSYEDTIRVADLKIRDSRFQRVHSEVRAQADQQVHINEFMHPRIEEICETLPAGLGRWLAQPHAVHRLVAGWTREGRVVRTSSLRGFALLWLLSRWRVARRSTLRFALENERIEHWFQRVLALAGPHPTLALEVARLQRLVKGYGDTHARGLRNYQTLMGVLDRHAPQLAPASLAGLRDAALADEHGHALKAALSKQALNA
ncbi:indolepyruvate oxidoreductase subunit beta family protein [Ideonella sp. B508-1]|uniref:indolepyruvate oxidoreductase subunit beta family protein n=1 Tax=Ideonella sp. B508-1 TaxID=137716 RepID=UPI0003484D71|nr:indolepyruvate oxidoreductase subunit beta family protein [Ideonella sp. B508-1]